MYAAQAGHADVRARRAHRRVAASLRPRSVVRRSCARAESCAFGPKAKRESDVCVCVCLHVRVWLPLQFLQSVCREVRVWLLMSLRRGGGVVWRDAKSQGSSKARPLTTPLLAALWTTPGPPGPRRSDSPHSLCLFGQRSFKFGQGAAFSAPQRVPLSLTPGERWPDVTV